jgi:hypothetical protein
MECQCIRCGKPMKNFIEDRRGLQPIGGLAFQTRGHYGSAYFDPMPEFGGPPDFLEIAVCDACVETAEREGIAFRYQGEKKDDGSPD